MDLFVDIYSHLLVVAFFTVPACLVRGIIIVVRALMAKARGFEKVRAVVVDADTVSIEKNGATIALPWRTRDRVNGEAIDLMYNGSDLSRPPRTIKAALAYFLSAALFIGFLWGLAVLAVG